MTERTKVIADGQETGDLRAKQRSYWGWLAAGTVIGFGLAFLVFGAEPIPPVGTQAVAPDVLQQSQDLTLGIGETIPGFKDGLVAVTSADGQTMDLTFWPVTGAELDRDMPLGTDTTRENVRFDAAGRRVAAMHRVPGEQYSGLAVGVPAALRLVDIDVTGYAWHDSLPGTLAYTTLEGRVLRIWKLDIASTEPDLLTSYSEFDGRLVAYGDWGFAIQDAAMREVTILSSAGVIDNVLEGRLLASRDDGWLFIDGDTFEIHGRESIVDDLESSYGVTGEVKAAEFSPDGRRLAMLDETGLLVVPVSPGGDVVRAEHNFGVAQIAWTSDSRFVMIPAIRGLSIVDTRDGDIDQVFADRTVFAVSALPLSSS